MALVASRFQVANVERWEGMPTRWVPSWSSALPGGGRESKEWFGLFRGALPEEVAQVYLRLAGDRDAIFDGGQE